MPDLWPSCGYRFLAVTDENHLAVSDDFLRMYLLRSELAPIPKSCDNELRLHDALLANMRAQPRGRPVYLAMAMDASHRLRLKSQNLPPDLPLARVS